MIRQATLEDSEQIASVHVASWRSAYRGIIADSVLNRVDTGERAAQWASILSEANQHVLVVDDERQIRGFVSFGRTRDADADPDRVGEIMSLYVHPEHWGGGMGARLCRAAVQRLAEAGHQEATLWVLEQNERGRRFYETMGFSVDGASNLLDPTLREIRYRLSLIPASRNS